MTQPGARATQAKKLYNQGLSVRGVARELRCSPTHAFGLLKRANYEPRDISTATMMALGRDPISTDAIAEAFERGDRAREIGETFGINRVQVYKTLRDHLPPKQYEKLKRLRRKAQDAIASSGVVGLRHSS